MYAKDQADYDSLSGGLASSVFHAAAAHRSWRHDMARDAMTVFRSPPSVIHVFAEYFLAYALYPVPEDYFDRCYDLLEHVTNLCTE